jgi:chemotaxis protein CheY-P-specific phosphatase CheC
MSALKEIGNIVLSAYVTALSVFLRTIIVPSPPDLTVGSSDEILKSISNCGKVFILLIDAVFEREQEKIAGRIEFLLTRGDKDLVQKFCRESLQNNNLPHVDDLGADFGGTFGPLGN